MWVLNVPVKLVQAGKWMIKPHMIYLKWSVLIEIMWSQLQSVCSLFNDDLLVFKFLQSSQLSFLTTQASVSQRAGSVTGTLTVRIARMKSPVSLLSVNHQSTLVQMTLLSASLPIRSAMEKWTVLTARTKDSSVVMSVLSVYVISSRGFSHPIGTEIHNMSAHGYCTHVMAENQYAADAYDLPFFSWNTFNESMEAEHWPNSQLVFSFVPNVFDGVEVRATQLLPHWARKKNLFVLCLVQSI